MFKSKKLISMLLAVAMVCSICCVSALAKTNAPNYIEAVEAVLTAYVEKDIEQIIALSIDNRCAPEERVDFISELMADPDNTIISFDIDEDSLKIGDEYAEITVEITDAVETNNVVAHIDHEGIVEFMDVYASTYTVSKNMAANTPIPHYTQTQVANWNYQVNQGATKHTSTFNSTEEVWVNAAQYKNTAFGHENTSFEYAIVSTSGIFDKVYASATAENTKNCRATLVCGQRTGVKLRIKNISDVGTGNNNYTYGEVYNLVY